MAAPGCPGLSACLRRNIRCGHAALVLDYRHNRQAWEQRLEAENPGLYDTEVAEWIEANPPEAFGATFKAHLQGTARREDTTTWMEIAA